MNYWPAEVGNLSECHEPLFELIARARRATAARRRAINYGARGWVAHHNTDLWRQTAPVGDTAAATRSWANWPMGGAWLCQHLWEHYAFTRRPRVPARPRLPDPARAPPSSASTG